MFQKLSSWLQLEGGFETMVNKILNILIAIVALMVVLVFTGTSPIHLVQVSGVSMAPTLKNGEILIAVNMSRDFKVGDMVGADPEGWNIPEGVVKRIVAGPGDEVIVDGVTLLINGNKVGSGTFPSSVKGYPYKKYTLGEDEYFLLGDNFTNSLDSRAHGPVKRHEIAYKVIKP